MTAQRRSRARIRVTCPVCRNSRQVRMGTPETCATCTPTINPPGPEHALAGGAWRLDPFARIVRWVKDAA